MLCPLGHIAVTFKRLDTKTGKLSEAFDIKGESPVVVSAAAPFGPPRTQPPPQPPDDDGKDDGKTPRSKVIAVRGIKSDHDFAALMDAIIADLADGRISPSVANAQLTAAGALLKVAEMALRQRDALARGARGELLLLPERRPA
jgi:hypothetical protein